MDPLELLQDFESLWQRQPVNDHHDDTPVTRDHLADQGFAGPENRHE